MIRVLALLLAVALVPSGTGAAPPEPDVRGWAGADLDGARKLAIRNHQPILVLLRKPRCRPCDEIERLLKQDPLIAPLTEPYIRVRADLTDDDGKTVGWNLRARVVPAVILLGPEGLEATRREGAIERTWLLEQLQMVVHRHSRGRVAPAPTENELQAGLDRLESWGDREGAVRLLERLSGTRAGAVPTVARHMFDPTQDAIENERDIERFLDRSDDPGEIRTGAFALALILEGEGRVDLALDVMQAALSRLGHDPLTTTRAGFLASRHGVRLESARQQLMAARELAPGSVPELMALARVAERSGRVFQALHAVEAARVYAPKDAWIAIELQRLELLTHLRSRKAPVRKPA